MYYRDTKHQNMSRMDIDFLRYFCYNHKVQYICSEVFTININKSNEIKYYIANPLHSCGLALVGTGSIIQGFLLKSGVSDKNVAFFVSAMLVVQMAAMTIMSGAVENMKKMIKVSAALALFQIPLLGLLAYFSFEGAVTNAPTLKLPFLGEFSAVYFAIFGASVLAAVFYGLHGVLSYKLPYKIMDIKEYGRILGVSGVFLGLCSTVFSYIISFFTNTDRFDYFGVMRIFFIVGIIFFVLSFFVASSYRELPKAVTDKKQNEKINIFKYKPFYILLAPNLLRGFHTGVWGVIMVIGCSSGIIDGQQGAFLSVLLQLALMIGCFIYSRISGRVEDGKLIFVSSLLTAVCAPFMLMGGSSTVFFAIYLIVSLFKNFIDYGVPTAVTKIVDYRCIGQYSAWRMVLHTLGTALGGIAVPYMMDFFGAFATLVIAGVFQALSGFVYYWYTNIYVKKNPEHRITR